jgi:hypothetical protein
VTPCYSSGREVGKSKDVSGDRKVNGCFDGILYNEMASYEGIAAINILSYSVVDRVVRNVKLLMESCSVSMLLVQ